MFTGKNACVTFTGSEAVPRSLGGVGAPQAIREDDGCVGLAVRNCRVGFQQAILFFVSTSWKPCFS
jgi:hypothetical protein